MRCIISWNKQKENCTQYVLTSEVFLKSSNSDISFSWVLSFFYISKVESMTSFKIKYAVQEKNTYLIDQKIFMVLQIKEERK